jgi:hypothetical protein
MPSATSAKEWPITPARHFTIASARFIATPRRDERIPRLTAISICSMLAAMPLLSKPLGFVPLYRIRAIERGF